MEFKYFVASHKTCEFIAKNDFTAHNGERATWCDSEADALDFGSKEDARDYIHETAAWLCDGRGEFEIVEAYFDDDQWCGRYVSSDELN